MFDHRATCRAAADRRAPRLPSAAALALVLLGGAACVTPKTHPPAAEERPARPAAGAAAAPTPPPAAEPGGASPDAEAARRDQEAARTRDHLQRIDAALAEVKGKLDRLDAANRAPAPPSTEPSPRERALAEEVKGLRATLEQQGQRLDALDRSLAQLRRGGERASAQGRAAPQERPAAPARGARQAAPDLPPAEPLANDRASVLALARDQERNGQRAVARELYEQYATQFPGDPQTAEVHYRLGELAFGDRRYRDAIVEFGKVASEFPRSGQAPGALLRTAESMLRLGMKDDAAGILGEIPRRYPGTPAAAEARRELERLPGSAGKRP
jgi:tol-pal system protein YbgF